MTETKKNSSAHVLAVANQKGGVGKTTTAINLAAALGEHCRVLLIDVDPQGNASTGLGVAYADRSRGAYAILTEEIEPRTLVRSTAAPNVDIVVANNELAGAEIELIATQNREYRMQKAIAKLRPFYDYILIDCPPSLGMLTLNALVAADGVLIPLQCEFFALEGISQIMRIIERVRKAFNPQLCVYGIVLTMYDRRNNLSELVAADAQSFFGDHIFKTQIPRNIRISEAQSHGCSVFAYDDRCTGAQAYRALACEMLSRSKNLEKEAL